MVVGRKKEQKLPGKVLYIKEDTININFDGINQFLMQGVAIPEMQFTMYKTVIMSGHFVLLILWDILGVII